MVIYYDVMGVYYDVMVIYYDVIGVYYVVLCDYYDLCVMFEVLKALHDILRLISLYVTLAYHRNAVYNTATRSLVMANEVLYVISKYIQT